PAGVTINSNHTVNNQGAVTNNQESGAVAIRAQMTGDNGAAQNLTSGIINGRTITVSGPAAGSAVYNTPLFNAGIRLDGLGTFTGNVINDTNGAIQVGGVSS